jgi:excisionase family DNA binding protein
MNDLLPRAGGRPATPSSATTLHLVDVTPVLDAIAELAAEVRTLRAEVVARRESSRSETMMTIAQIAELLQVCRRTVARWVSDGLFPAGTRWIHGGSSGRRWRRAEVEAWIAQHAKRS